jgi:phosphate-selective porin OprO/OprP
LWVTFKELPYIGNLRIGNQKPAIGFEHLTSSRFLNFLERSLQFDAFIENQNNGFEPGIAAFDTFFDERATWNIGVFKNTRNIMGWNVGDGEYDVTGRVTCLPIYENEGEYLVHLGLAASHRDLDDDFDRIRARLLLRNGPAVLHNIVAEVQTLGESRDQVAPEFVVVWGPLTFQSEYHRVWVHDATTPVTGAGPRTNHGTVQYQGAYAELLYFLTGEHQTYDRKRAAFTRTTPHSPFRGFGMDGEGCDDGVEDVGLGAWQVGVRYSWLDLNDKGIHGSVCQDITVGLNWFLNPYMKWQWNYCALHRNAPGTEHDGWVYGFGTRIAIDF